MNNMKRTIAAICIFLFTISLCACGGATPTEVTAQFLDDFKVQENVEGFSSIVADDEMSRTREYFEDEIIPMILDFDYELSNERIDGEEATVDVSVTAYDFGDAMSQSNDELRVVVRNIAGGNPEAEDIDAAMKAVYRKNFDRVEKTYAETVSVKLVKENGDWTIDDIEKQGELMNAITGGLLKAAAQ